MTYTLTIPLSTTYVDEDQPLILDNFTTINTDFGNDHYAFTELTNQGKHKQTTFVAQATPVMAGTDIALYNKLVGALPALFINGVSRAGGISNVNITAAPTVVITVPGGHGLAGGETVTISGIAAGSTVELNGNSYVIAVVSPTTFSVTQAGALTAYVTGSGGIWTLAAAGQDFQISGNCKPTTTFGVAGESPIFGGFNLKFGTFSASNHVTADVIYTDLGLTPYTTCALAVYLTAIENVGVTNAPPATIVGNPAITGFSARIAGAAAGAHTVMFLALGV